ncbi:MAG: sigma-70 family RNA polymerase sigma factor [Selenomonadaceae bacterium]|nr:sigma-70 family RNA polymerase sigma factor [Selenomonadaceae bacterium]
MAGSESVIEKYIKSIEDVKMLEPEEEAKLWMLMKEKGDMEARRKLIASYQPLVIKEGAKFSRAEAIADILQEGTVGLIEAVESYDYKRGVHFSLFAAHRIRGRMLNFIKKEGLADVPFLDAETQNGVPYVEMVEDERADVSRLTEQKVIKLKLLSAVERLPLKERAVLEGVYLRDESVKEVAGDMSLTAAHIYRLQKTAIKRVRGMLSKFWHNW